VPGPPVIHGDRDGGLSLLNDRTWEATLDTCGYVPRVVRQSARLPGIAAGHYTFVSSLSVYPTTSLQAPRRRRPGHGPSSSDTEGTTGESYGPLKVACESEVQSAFPGSSYGAVVRQLTNWRAPDDPRGSARVP
jgi:2'-hydroxyisoflavone reductase